MRRAASGLLVLAVIAAAVSIWVGRGRPLPAWTGRVVRSAPAADATPLPSLDRPARLAILNGTGVTGLANTFALAVPQVGCVAERVGNAPHRHFERTLLVNRRLAGETVAAIGARLGVTVLQERDDATTEDAVLVVGADYRDVLERVAARGR